MALRKTHNQFLETVSDIVKKNFTIIGQYKGSDKKILIIHNESCARFNVFATVLIKNRLPNIKKCLDKTIYFQYLVSKVNSDLTIISEYINDYTYILSKDSAGIIYNTRPSNLLRGFVPTITSAKYPNECFKIKAQKIHGDKYDYSKINYVNAIENIDIICNIHGVFNQQANSHLQGSGCPECAKYINSSGFSRNEWVENGLHSKHFDGFKIYIIKCWNNDECFIKIGRTYTKMYNRFRNGNTIILPYHYKVLDIIEGDGYYIYDLENYIHSELFKFKYIPAKNFNGCTECFNCTILDKYKIIIESFNPKQYD